MENTSSNQYSELQARASVTAPDLGIDPMECVAPELTDPCTIVIAGATGDLTARKLIPALFHLYLNDGLPRTFQIVGCARTGMGDNEFRNKMKRSASENKIG
jgi:glucose-6-phosphate 1-dehydrogenase